MNKVIIVGPNVGMGGVERASCNLANGFKAKGMDVTYLALIPKVPFFNLSATYREPNGFNTDKIDLFKTIFYIRKSISELSPHAIIGFTKFYASLVNIALIGTSFRLFVTERSSPLYKWPRHIDFFCCISFSLRKVSGVISQTKIAGRYHQTYYGNTSYTVIPNALRKVVKYPEVKREKVLLAVGRLNDPCKGFDLLVQAFNKINDPEWSLYFAGGTKEEGQYLIDQASQKVKDRIIFLGSVKDIDKEYARAGIFVMPSRSEGFPNALCEAMAAGCPCISFDFVAGPNEIITNGVDGILVPPGDVDELIRNINILIEDEDLRNELGEKATKLDERLAETKIIDQYTNFIF